MGITQQIGASSLIKPGVIDNTAALPASPYEGQVIYQKDTDAILVWNGTAWYPNWNLPWGVAGDTGATAGTAFTANTALTVLTLPTTIYAGRKYQVFGKLAMQHTTSSTVGAALFVTGNSINRTLYYQTAAVSQYFCLGINGFTTYTATELGVTSGSSSVSIALKFKSGGAGNLNTDPDAYVAAGSFSQQLTVIDIGPA
jgi:hypothetical protein